MSPFLVHQRPSGLYLTVRIEHSVRLDVTVMKGIEAHQEILPERNRHVSDNLRSQHHRAYLIYGGIY